MAKKKSKRPNLSAETLERARAEMQVASEPQTQATTAGVVAAPAVSSVAKNKIKRAGAGITRYIPSTDELIKEYTYVMKDLRNLAIIAGTLMLIIVIAAVVLPRPTG